MKYKGYFSTKIGKIKLGIMAILMIAIMAIILFAIQTQAATGFGKVANEDSLVRMTAGLVLGSNTDRTVTREGVADKLKNYIAASKTTVTDNTTRDVIIVKYLDTGNEYEILKGSKYVITFEANGTGVTGMPENQVKGHGIQITITSEQPSRDGYRFKGWSTVSTDTTGNATYAGGQQYATNASITLYAIWQQKYTVTYDANGGSGAPTAQDKWHDETLTLSSTKPTLANHNFLGWAESNTATTAAYQPGGDFTGNKNTTLYAVWQEKYTVTYNVNGGSGTFANQTKLENVNLTLHSTTPTRTGYTFTGWKSSATSTTWAAGTTAFNENNNTTLTAQWSENYLTVKYYSNYATSSFSGPENAVGADKNVVVRTYNFYYATAYTNGLHDYVTSGSGTYLARTGYNATGYWGTTTSGGTKVSQSTSFESGQALAQAFGKDLSSANQTINLYAQWNIASIQLANALGTKTHSFTWSDHGSYGSQLTHGSFTVTANETWYLQMSGYMWWRWMWMCG